MGDWFDEAGAGSAVALHDVWIASNVDALLAIVGSGALVSVGLSRDGGSCGVTVTVDGRWRREWFRDAEALASWLEAAYEAVKDIDRRETASSGARDQRPRRRA